MGIMLVIHILAAAVAIVVGYVALFAAKGKELHRRSGILFVYAMVTMGLSAMLMAAVRGVESSVIAGLMAAYMVVTALTAVRTPTEATRRLDRAAMVAGLTTSIGSIALGVAMFAGVRLSPGGAPAPVLFLFGTIGLLAGLSDVRVVRAGGVKGRPRITRHLWRMCFALWLAATSFFLGQADEIPEPLRIPSLLALLAFLPVVVMFYWLWRVRPRRARRLAPDAPRIQTEALSANAA